MKGLQECANLQEAQPFLRGRSATFRKTVETALILRQNPDPAQRALGDGFMAVALQEMDKAEEPAEHHGDNGLKTKGEHFVKEEELAGGNPSGTEGSEQSSKNSEPVTSKEGTTEPEGDMEEPGMATENQFSEAFGQPPAMPGMGPPGLDPNIAQQMAPQMPQIPPMNTPQQVQQMQYTVKKYMEAYVRPLSKQVIALTKANTYLSQQIKEIQTLKTGLDLHTMKQGSIAPLQETIPRTVSNVGSMGVPPQIYEKHYDLEAARQQIRELDDLVSNSKNQPYQ